jgi:hypothetical protein
MCFEVLSELSPEHDIDYKKVLSEIPTIKNEFDTFDYSLAVIPEGIEKTPHRFRIDFCNRWMIKQAQYVVTYITNPFGQGAAKYAAIAERQGKTLIKIGEY